MIAKASLRQESPLVSCEKSQQVKKFGQLFALLQPIMDNNLTFITSPASGPLFNAATRRAIVRPTCPATRVPRTPVTMKKVRRGAINDESNAVDVFGGAVQSQEDLLAAALGETPGANGEDSQPAAAANGGKKKKKKKKGAAVDEEENAVDVFASANVSQEELLAEALGTNDPPPASPKQGKKKKAKGKGAIVNEDENAVDVFGSSGKSQEDLLAEALGENESAAPANNSVSKKKKKGKKGKGGIVFEDEDNAVDVFASPELNQEDLLTSVLGEDEGSSVNLKAGKKKKKGKKGKSESILEDDENATDVFVPVEEHVLDVESEQMQSTGKKSKDLNKHLDSGNGKVTEISELVDDLHNVSPQRTSSQNGTSTGIEMETELREITSEIIPELGEPIVESDSPFAIEEEPEENFEPDQEVIQEFDKSKDEFFQYTASGRREKARSKRKERTDEDTRLGDLKRANFGTGGEKYTSVRLEDVTIDFRGKKVLNGVTWGVHSGERVGLIGENGCGKTTQLRIIAGLVEPTSGDVARSSSRTKASFLRQEFVDELDPTRTLREEFLSAFKEKSELIRKYKECEDEIASAGEDLERLEMLLNQMEELRVKCDETDAWNLDSNVDKVMPGLGFVEDDNDKLVASFSGGWKVRIGLGKVLLQNPDLLLLDEPSNHLDNESVEWLEEYLQTCKLPMVVVSHDREFLDRVCTKIVEIENGEAFEYPGNYTTFVKLKKEQRAAWEAAYERQQKFINEQTSYIKRNRRNPARSSQVKSRQKMLERMERTGQIVRRPPRQGKPLVFRFPPAPRSGRDCILVEDLTHGYGNRVLFNDASIGIERGDRIALIGPNGSGKTTLLRLITGREAPQEGTVECQGLTNISLAYYEQNQADALDLEVTVLETLKEAAPVEMAYEEIRSLLGKFLFKGDDVEKKVGALSGGEKARLALAKIMLTPSNVLILDEPGNHLSISAKEMLEEALQNFDGTFLLVSHDRYLISQVATQIVAVEDKELVLYDGDYKSYMEKNAELNEKLRARFIPGIAEIKNAPKTSIDEPIEFVEKKTKRKKNFGGSGVQSGKTKEMNAKRWNRR